MRYFCIVSIVIGWGCHIINSSLKFLWKFTLDLCFLRQAILTVVLKHLYIFRVYKDSLLGKSTRAHFPRVLSICQWPSTTKRILCASSFLCCLAATPLHRRAHSSLITIYLLLLRQLLTLLLNSTLSSIFKIFFVKEYNWECACFC